MTKANGKSQSETWRGRREGSRGGEWVDLGEWQARPRGRPSMTLTVPASRSCLPHQKQGCWQKNLLLLIFLFQIFFFFLCGPSVLLTFPPVYLPNSLSTIPSSIGVSGTSQLSLCRLSRWPSLRSALECCFYIAASGGMWSLFWTA